MSFVEKDAAVGEVETSCTGLAQSDAAGEFLRLHDHVEAAGSVNITALRRKIDFHIVPLMFCCYTMQFLDKVILNVSQCWVP
jgi:hypothetical protein